MGSEATACYGCQRRDEELRHVRGELHIEEDNVEFEEGKRKAVEAEVEQLRALLRQVREATDHVKWAHDICHLIDESGLLGDSDG